MQAKALSWLLFLHRSYRRHRVHPDLPWTSGAVYAVAVHWRRGDVAQPDSVRFTRAVVSEEQLMFAMEVMRKAVMDAGENHGQAIVFHVFTQVVLYTYYPRWNRGTASKSMSIDSATMQGKADCCYKLSTRNDTILHIAAETNVQRKNHHILVPARAVRQNTLGLVEHIRAATDIAHHLRGGKTLFLFCASPGSRRTRC
jgi:hypothetical protein